MPAPDEGSLAMTTASEAPRPVRTARGAQAAWPRWLAAACGVAVVAALAGPAQAKPSHPAMRPLPVASDRPLASGPAYYVDPVKGDAAGDGSPGKPWKTIAASVTRLKPGDTLVLRG